MDRKTFLKGMVLAPLAAAVPGVSAAAEPVFARVVELKGEVTIDGQRAWLGSWAREGQKVEVGRDSHAILKFEDESALHLRENTVITVTRPEQESVLSVLAGRVIAMFEPGEREVRTSTTVAGVRGTAMYVMVENPDRTYFCVCFGTVDFTAIADPSVKTTISAEHHEALWVNRSGSQVTMEPAPMLDHTDAELEHLKTVFDKPYYFWRPRKR